MPHFAKEGDTKTLRWNLGRDLTAVTQARVIISREVAVATPAVDRNGVIDAPPSAGIVSLALVAGDYAAGKLEAGLYRVEIETQPGPLTHPDSGYELLHVVADLA